MDVRAYLADAVAVQAEITEFRYVNMGIADHADNDFQMWVSFPLANGETVSAPTNVLGSNDLHRIGETVRIYHRPDHIGRVRVDSFWSLYLLPTVFLGLAALIVAGGLLRSRKRR